MQIGQPGDNRKYGRPKKGAYYASKSAVEAEKRYKKPKCRVCGLTCEGQTFGSPPDDVTCLRCWSEGSG